MDKLARKKKEKKCPALIQLMFHEERLSISKEKNTPKIKGNKTIS